MRLLISAAARRDLAKIRDAKMQSRIEAALAKLATDPMRRGAKALQGKAGDYLRVRVGEFRIVYEIQGDAVVVLRVGNRRDVYR